MKTTMILAGAALALLAACSKPASVTDEKGLTVTTTNTVAVVPPAPPPPPEPPPHHYTVKEGVDYGYTHALGDDDQKAGVGAGNITMYRYLGEVGGVYTVQDSDNPTLTFSCTKPCAMVKGYVSGTLNLRRQYVPTTVIGAVFDDALNGYLSTPAGSATPGEKANIVPNAVQSYNVPKRFPVAYAAWRRGLKLWSTELANYDWATTLSGVAGAMTPVTVNGRTMLYGNVCEPHNCGDNNASFMIDPETQKIAGVVQVVDYDTDGTRRPHSYNVYGGLSGPPPECVLKVRDTGAETC